MRSYTLVATSYTWEYLILVPLRKQRLQQVSKNTQTFILSISKISTTRIMGSIEQPTSSETYPPLPADVLIVGTGLAGSTAALECSRKGMKVHILERNSTINTAGVAPLSLNCTHEESNNYFRRHVLHRSQRHKIVQTLARDAKRVRQDQPTQRVG
jgi:hypothetical protein